MRSSRPKVLHTVAGQSLVGHVLAALRAAGGGATAVVVGPDRDDVAAEARAEMPGAQIFVQRERRGTAHAVLAARAALEKGADDILIIFGDTPLIKPQTLAKLRQALADGANVVVLGFKPADPTGYGRLVTKGAELLAIVEHADATEEQRGIALCNGGLMAFDGAARAADPRPDRQRQSQGRILSDRRGGDCAQDGPARRRPRSGGG